MTNLQNQHPAALIADVIAVLFELMIWGKHFPAMMDDDRAATPCLTV